MNDFVSQMRDFEAELFATAMQYCKGNEADAEDLLQDTFFKGYRSSHRFTPGTNLRAWLHTILRNAYISKYRRQSRFWGYVSRVKDGALDAIESAQDVSPEDVAQARDEFEYILGLIQDKIPPPFFDVMVMVDLQDASYREAAEAFGVPVGTIMSRLYRARHASRAILLENYENLPSYAAQS